MRRSGSGLTWFQALSLGGLLVAAGCSGGDYEDRFKKSMDHLKATGNAIRHDGTLPEQPAPEAPGDKPANPAPAPNS